MAQRYVLDTSLLLGGQEPPPGRWMTTPEADLEVKPGGRDARRYAFWKEKGLEIRAADILDEDRVDEMAMQAGTLGRLSPADRSLLALAVGTGATLVTEDHTMLDIAKRLGLEVQTFRSSGIEATMDWKPRCTGCGRWFDAPQKRDECPVCGSPVKDKPVKNG